MKELHHHQIDKSKSIVAIVNKKESLFSMGQKALVRQKTRAERHFWRRGKKKKRMVVTHLLFNSA